MTPTPTLVEKIAEAWADERHQWMMGSLGVFKMRDAREDDRPVFRGDRNECEEFIAQHCARAALAVVMAELREPTEAMVAEGTMVDINSMWAESHHGKPVKFPLGVCLLDTGCRDINVGIANTWRAMLAAFERENAG